MNLATDFKWDQSKFDAALRQKLDLCKAEKVPNAINKTAFFVALRAYKETPKKEPFAIQQSVSKEVSVTNKKGQKRNMPLLWVLAAKSVSKTYQELKMTRGENRKRAVKAGKFYLQQLAKKSKTILGSRKRASGFFRVGFLSVIQTLAPFVKGKGGASYVRDGSAIRGQLKGDAKPATGGMAPTCTITNSATAKSALGRNGLFRLVAPALQRAMDAETQSILDHLSEEVNPVLNGPI